MEGTHTIVLPNGREIDNVPLGTSKTEIMRKAVESGLATYQDFGEKIDPTEGEGFGRLALEGAGKAFVDLSRGLKQALNIGDQDKLENEITESRRLDAPLMDTAGGLTGNIGGNVAAGVPAFAIPGVNTVAGSALVGGAYGGALTPTTEDESALNNAIGGATFGAAGQLAARGVPAIYNAITRPFHKGGREKIAAETIERFATNKEAISNPAKSQVPGIKYSLAEATQDPGIAILERGARNADPVMGGTIGAQEQATIGAVRDAIGGIAGDDAAMAAAKAARKAENVYDDVLNAAVLDPDDALKELLQRPAAQEAMEGAEKLALEAGEEAPSAARWLHYVKMAMDDMLDPSAQSGAKGNAARAIKDTRKSIVNWMDDNIDGYSSVRAAYEKNSKPINQMQVGRYVRDKLNPALNDFGVDIPNTRPAMYAQALRDAESTVKRATDFGGATLENTMTPEQLQTLSGVGEYFARREGARNLGRAAGTNTAQNLSTNNLLRQVAGPLGVPESWAESALAQSIMRPVSFMLQPAENATQQVLARALSDPAYAQQVMRNAAPSQRKQLIQALLNKTLPGVAAGGAVSAVGQ